MSDYTYWMNALRLTDGKRVLTRPEMASLGISEDVGYGFFRMRSGPRQPFTVPVAIFERDNTIIATWGDNNMLVSSMPDLGPVYVWLNACKWPIHEDAYRHRIATGAWPEEGPTVPVTAEELAESEREFK